MITTDEDMTMENKILMLYYKQVRPLAALASLRALRPAYGRPQRAHAVLLRCVSLWTVL